MRTRGLQPRLLYPARLSINIEGKIRTLPEKKSLKEYTSMKPGMQEKINGLLSGKKGKERQREEHR